jgi:choline transport protein
MIIMGLSGLVTIVTLPAKADSHTSARFIFTNTENVSGWSSYGAAFLLGLINSNYAFGLIDATVHLAEEITEPERNVPKALYYTVIVGFITAWPTALVFMYCLVDFNAVSTTATGVPLLELFHLTFNSKGLAIFFLFLVMLTYFVATIALQAYQARICWAFSRDNGIPFASHWSKVHPKLKVPINAHLLCVTAVSILSIIVIASTTAFNRYVTFYILLTYIFTYTISFTVLLPVSLYFHTCPI